MLSREGIRIRKPARLLAESFRTLREIWRGGPLTFSGLAARLTAYVPRYSPSEPIPVYFGVRGPKLLEYVSKFADGLLLSGPRSYIGQALDIVRRGRAERAEGRPIVGVWFPLVLGRRQGTNHVKRAVARILGDTPPQALEMSDLPAPRCRRIQELVGRADMARAARLVDDRIIEDICLRGEVGEISSQLVSLRRFGADELVLGPPLTEDWVGPSLDLIESWPR